MTKILMLLVVFLPFCAAPVCYLIGRRSKPARNLTAALTGGLDLAFALCLAFAGEHGAEVSLPGIVSLGLNLSLTGFSKVYVAVTALAWFLTLTFSGEYFGHYRNRNRYYLFNLLTLGASQGVFLSADLCTTLCFFEVMSFTSYAWVAHDETEGAMRAANTYLGVAVIGGLAALMGLFLFQVKLGTTRIDALAEALSAYKTAGEGMGWIYTAAGCVLAGFGAKAGMFPLHIWLPKAHPVAPAPASALLSGVLTKTGVFGVAALSCRLLSGDRAWAAVILILGTVTMVLGAVLALLSIDLKRTLACSSMSQIGFILVGVGCGTILGEHGALAARGAVLHMLNHTLIKLVLFMAAGAVYMNLHKLDLNDIRGFGRKKPFLAAVFLCGALGIAGFPLFNGYLSKSLLHEGILESAELFSEEGLGIFWLKAMEWLFLFSGGLTAAYMTKLFVAIFVEQNADPALQARYDGERFACKTWYARAALGFSALLLPVLGLLPGFTAGPISSVGSELFGERFTGAIHWFSLENLKGAAISLCIGGAVYFGVVRLLLMKQEKNVRVYVNRLPAWLDLENAVYRPLLLRVLPGALGWLAAVLDRLPELLCGRWTLRVIETAAHVFGDALDLVILLLRRTLYRELPREDRADFEHDPAYRLGAILDRFKGRRSRRNYAERLFNAEHTIGETTHRLTGSLSFALLMLCVGLTLVFLYLIVIK